MPVQSPLTKKSSIVHRSESLRSEVSDASQQSKRVSFNRDVHVKRIPRGSAVLDRNGKLVAVLDGVSGSRGGQNNHHNNSHNLRNPNSNSTTHSHPHQINGRLWINSLAPSSEILPEEELLREAQTILKHVDNISCTTTGGGGYDTGSASGTKSLERNSSRYNKQNAINNNNNNNNNSASGNKPKLQKSSSRLSEFFSKTLPNQIRNKYNNNSNNNNTNGNRINNNSDLKKLTKSTQNLVTHNELERNASTGSSGTQSSIDISHIGKNNGSGHGKGDKPRLKLKRSVSSDLSFGNLNGSISKSDPNLYKGGVRYKKVAKIKKPHGIRVALNSIGETPSNSSASASASASGSTSSKRSDSDSHSNSSGSEELAKKLPVSTSDSPVSSLSGPEEPIMANSLHSNTNFGNQHSHRVSSIVQQLSNRRSQESPERNLNNLSSYRSPVPVVEPLVGNTHNNNKPFSYISGLGNSDKNINTNTNNSASASVSPTRPERSRSKSPLKNTENNTTSTNGNGKILSSPKEVIYAQVVCSGKPGESGSGEKRTVHTTVTNGVNNNKKTTFENSNSNSNPNSNRSSPQRTLLNNTSNNNSPSVSPNKIQHFVYDHPNNNSNNNNKNDKNSKLRSESMNHHSSFRTGPGTGTGTGIGNGYRSLYDDYDFSTAKPRNNVTTVLLNNVDDDDDTSFSSSRHNTNSHFNSNHRSYLDRDRSPSPSPNYRKPEQSFYFGNSPSPGDDPGIGNVHSPFASSSFNYKSPTRTNGYLSSSREVSPATKAVSSALLVRDAERKKGSLVSSAKLVSTYGVPPSFADRNESSSTNRHNVTSDFDYMQDRYRNRNLSSSESPTRHSQSPSRTFNSHHTDSFPSSRSKYNDHLESTTTTSRNNNNTTSTAHRLHDPYPSSNTKKLRIGIGSSGSKTGTPNASNSSVNKIGLRSKENSPVRSYDRDYTKSASPGKSTMGTLRRDRDRSRDRDESSLERKYNKKNKDEQELREKTSTLKTSTITNTSNNNNNSGGGGMFSTLMRRNKDKKIQKEIKEKEKKENLSNNEGSDQVDSASNKESKIKRQRAKFFSAFLDKSFSSKSKNPTSTSPVSGPGSGPESKSNKSGKNTAKPTDSEIEDAERRRDGEYHSWSSGDDEYRFGHHRNGQLTRGKSYNFGDLNEESGTKPWYDQNDSDYRRDMATSRYTSATLGRPGMRSSNHNSDNDMSRSKSLDRRAFHKHRSRSRSPAPRIIVTPNTPQVEESDKWKNTYDPIIRSFDRDRMTNGTGNPHHSPTRHHPTLSKRVSGLSKSSYELDDSHQRQGSSASSKLRYFGDTDAEYADHSAHHLGKSQQSPSKFIPRSSSYLSRGKENHSKYYTVPGSSLNSSGSENGSRMSNSSQRSVFLHAPAIASIPPSGMQKRTLSRDELSNYSGSQKQTKHLARSMSVLAPWRPRHYRERYEVNYSNNDTKENQLYTRPPKPPRSPTRKSMSPSHGGSTDSLLKLVDDRRSKSPTKTGTLTRKDKGNSLSRSKSMPKDTRLAGWRSTLRWPKFGGGKDKGEKGEGKT